MVVHLAIAIRLMFLECPNNSIAYRMFMILYPCLSFSIGSSFAID